MMTMTTPHCCWPPGRVRRPVQRRHRRLLGFSLLAPSFQASACSVTFVRLGDLDAGNLLDRPRGRGVTAKKRQAGSPCCSSVESLVLNQTSQGSAGARESVALDRSRDDQSDESPNAEREAGSLPGLLTEAFSAVANMLQTR